MPKSFDIGDVIHGAGSCGNVYQIIAMDRAKNMILGYCIEIDTPLWSDMYKGNFVIRGAAAIIDVHLANECPHA